MSFYKHYQKKPLSKANQPIDCFSKVQSGLVPPLKSIVQNPQGFGYGVGFQPLSNETIPIQYSKESFTELHKKFENLKSWYNDNKETIEKVKRGDYSSFKPKEEPYEETKVNLDENK